MPISTPYDRIAGEFGAARTRLQPKEVDHLRLFYDSLPPERMVAQMEDLGFEVVVAEMCEAPDGGRNRGKWATIATRPRGTNRGRAEYVLL